jgi:hypothetical protein
MTTSLGGLQWLGMDSLMILRGFCCSPICSAPRDQKSLALELTISIWTDNT